MKYGAMNFPIKPVMDEIKKIAGLGFDYIADFLSSGDINFTDSRLTYTDQASGRRHLIEEIRFSLPKRDKDSISISPHFSAVIDGSPISVGGQSESSATGQNTRLTFTLKDIHLADYLAYLPAPLPGLVSKGVADMDLLVEYDAINYLWCLSSIIAADII